ncbi:hypothetical protein [Hyphomonas sp.]
MTLLHFLRFTFPSEQLRKSLLILVLSAALWIGISALCWAVLRFMGGA